MQVEAETDKPTIRSEWERIYSSKDSKFILVGNVDSFRYRKEGEHVVVYNKTFARKNMGTRSVVQAHKKRVVFLGFQAGEGNFTDISSKEVLFFVNLDEEEIISRQNAGKITEQFFDKDDADENDNIEGHVHPLLINTSPLCRNHTLLVMYPEEELPQIIGSDIVLLLLNIFTMIPDIKVGYDSIGAGSNVNHLHFHLIYSQDLIGTDKLPIETQPRTAWMKSSLINPKEEINLYSVGVQMERIQTPMVDAIVLRALDSSEIQEQSEVTNSLSFIFGIVANELIELCVPHNILFAENGRTIYMMLREFGSEANSYGWLEYSGVVSASSEAEQAISEKDIWQVKQDARVDEKIFATLKARIAKNLQHFI